jgi:exopolyphosphatase/guanosine-5'-triphosphate,3'-diphosphate pyrophosphatase
VAAFDCGTNSLRLLVAEVDAHAGTLVDLDRRMEVVRLGERVDATGRIAQEAMARALAVTRAYAQVCREAGVERLRFVATSATRDAANRAEFVDGVRAVLGVEPEVIVGEVEAALSFDGATHDLAAEHREPFLVVDLGGGSTEFVLGHAGSGGDDGGGGGGGGVVEAAGSVDVGCVRLTERHLHSDPPTVAEIAAARADVEAALDHVERVVPFERAATLVGVAGTVTTVTAHALGLPEYDAGRIHRAVLGVGAVRAACRDLLGMTRAQRAALPYLHPGRVDVLGAGALVWERVVERVARRAGLGEVVTSEHDILDGLAWSLAAAPW